MTKHALIVVDVQNDFVNNSNLVPDRDLFLQQVAEALNTFRSRNIPIIHAHYISEPDGRGQLPHHKKWGIKRCMRGNPGAHPPPAAVPLHGEPVFEKYYYSAFSSPKLEEYLKALDVDTLLICGLFSHLCVRQTALDALERDYRVKVLQEAIASDDPLHAQITQKFLEGRCVEYFRTRDLRNRLFRTSGLTRSPSATAKIYPSSCINNNWIESSKEGLEEIRNPSNWDQILGYVPLAGAKDIDAAVSHSLTIQSEWKSIPLEKRLEKVRLWLQVLEANKEHFITSMIEEIGKPLGACRAEFTLLKDSIQVMLKTFTGEALEQVCKFLKGQIAYARRRPLGVVGIIAPWNNPLFLPASKIAAAISLGNGVVWKPALPAPGTSMLIQKSLAESSIPAGLVNLVFGGSASAQTLIAHPGIHAVTITGSVNTGKQVAAVCGSLLKPLQAELGGNNATVVTEDCDLSRVAELVTHHAFGYAGQACTATRRLILIKSVKDKFLSLLKKSVEDLTVGDPRDEKTMVGPVISKTHQQRINKLISEAGPGLKIFEKEIPQHLSKAGCWLPPRVIDGLPESAPLVQMETFAPLLIIQEANDLKEAIRLCNCVSNGLIASIFSNNKSTQQDFRDSVDTGIVQLNLPSRNLHMESPFGGWKESGLGPPEHGVWDLDFYTRWQAVNQG